MDIPTPTKESPKNLVKFNRAVEAKFKLAEKPNLKEKDIFIMKNKKKVKKVNVKKK
tara:strand:+ start:374 stop:541 length:168 start_codon:yes stop_codon:yes gene_type:complete